MIYNDLYEGMKLICNQSNGNKKGLIVIRKGIDGFGIKSVIFQSMTSVAQFYCKENDIPYWNIEPFNEEV